MDAQTLRAYDANAEGFADDWHSQPAPSDLHAIVRRFFSPGLTADIGCGSGREVAWLAANGFSVVGYDACERLLDQARVRYPNCTFRTAALPDLSGIADDSFDNVLCETVIMHLPHEAIAAAVRRLLAILRPGGILYLSWRVTEANDRRDERGRLYAAFEPDLVRRSATGCEMLLDESVVSASSRNLIHRLVMLKPEARPV
jgi:SAM-dependent methyltransferase